jgi:plasmid maintenance system antidote protein VapI
MSDDFWLNLQLRWDLYRAKQKEKNVLQLIKPLHQTRSNLAV